MKEKKQKQVTRQEAKRITAGLKKDMQGIEKSWFALGRRAAVAIERRVPYVLNLQVADWMEQTFGTSSSHVYRLAHSYRALTEAGVPEKKQEALPEASAHRIATQIPREDRPKFVQAAIEEEPKKFAAIVREHREKKYGLPTVPWATFAIRLPKQFVDDLHEWEARYAAAHGLSLEDPAKRIGVLVQIWEATVANLMLMSEEEIRAWSTGDTEGKPPSDSSGDALAAHG